MKKIFNKEFLPVLISFLYLKGFSGSEIDKAVQCFRNISTSKPFFSIELESINVLSHMMKHSDHPHVYGENSIFYFNAFYNANKNFPIPRIYYIKEANIFKMRNIYEAIGKEPKDMPVYHHQNFCNLFAKDYENIIREFNDSFNKKDHVFNQMFDSRRLATNVEEGMRFFSDKCILCGSEDIGFSTTTIDDREAFLFGITLCNSCGQEALKSGNLNYISEKLNFPIRFRTKDLTKKEILDKGKSVMESELECEIIKIVSDKREIHGRRKSGFKIIFRLESSTDYAYMVNDPKNVEVARFDSADHHSGRIPFGPDHFHPEPNKKNVFVESSFLYGLPSIDIKSLIKIIEKKEKEYIR